MQRRILTTTTLMALFVNNAMAQQAADNYMFEQQVVQRVMTANREIDKISEELKEARIQSSSDTVKIKERRKEIVDKCFKIPQEYIAHNPGSPLAINALLMMGEGAVNMPVKLDELKKIFDGLSLEVRISRVGLEYANKLESWKWMNVLKNEAKSFKTISTEDAKLSLNNASDRLSISKGMPRLDILSEDELRLKLAASTLIIGMAHATSESDVQINPATAFVIDSNGICVTNYHVIKEYSSGKNYFALLCMNANGKIYPVKKILAASESDDLAIFQVENGGVRLIPLPFGSKAGRGTAVSVMSHPRQNFYRLTTGEIVQYKTSVLFNKPCEIMNITAEFEIGSSGGPVVDQKGNLIGVVSRLFNHASGQVDKFAIPVGVLKNLLVIEE